MAQQDAVIRLLLVEDQLEDAEHLISMLRNGGMAIRPQRPESEEELNTLLSGQSIDMVLASFNAKYIPFATVAKRVEATGKDIPVLAATSVLDEATVLAAIAAGGRDVALRTKPEHVQFVVRNEFHALLSRRGLRHLEASLRETERRCDALIASSRDPIAYVHEGMHIRANAAYLEMFGFEDFDEIEGLSVLDLIAPANAETFKQLLKKISKGEAPPRQLEIGAQRTDGSKFDAVMEFTPATYEGEACLQIVFRQQTVDAEMVKELDTLRQRDPVTGLFNRQHFMTEVEVVVAAAADGKGKQSLLLIEPDNYDARMDEIGLALADDLLKQVAARLSENMEGEPIIARFGDHTFAVLSRDHDYNQTLALADKIRLAFDGHVIDLGKQSITMTVSIGGVQIGEKIASVPQVLAKSNQCLQSAEGVGGNRIEIFDPAARDRVEEERIQAWVARIKEALAENQFVLNFQPMISLTGDTDENYEVLVRMKAPSGEIVAPEQFMPIAEEHGLLTEIDRWVVARTIELLSERKKAGKATTLYVKLSPSSLVEGDLHNFISSQLKANGVSGENLVLQLPESKVYAHLRPLQSFQKIISTFGCRLCLEQFGTSLNSFQMLTHFDPAILKIDRSFIVDLAKNADNQKKVREFAEQARNLGKLTIAEFVSDAGSMTVLFSIGVDLVQGNFLAPPAPTMNYEFG
ncbi:MAG TPA: EAL domain-containing protein [Arenimonas sp.]|uniref:EAL domain-containing response regulator n=1 Tax=Arenimonas sp. TaxID=1872635 RepID=UPI002BF7733B|nr:EAL domain-containing protein [Arenimonas sp.]HMB56002.1 EAL domain-containing protein [Arenimonas sp.]